MEIGLLVIFDDIDTLEGKFAALHENGFKECQLNCWIPELWTQENADKILTWLEKYQLKISAVWCGWEGPAVWDFIDGPLTLGLLPTEFRAMRIKNLCDGADFAKLLGVTDVATHMGFIPEDPNDPAFGPFCVAVRCVAKHLQKNGQYLLFETGQETPVAMMRCFQRVGTDNLGVNLDTANLILYGKANPVDALEVFGPYVRNLHAKDGCYPTDPMKLGKEVLIGQGKVDFPALFRKLHDLGYNGPVTIEQELRHSKLEDILNARAYLQGIVTDVYGGTENA